MKGALTLKVIGTKVQLPQGISSWKRYTLDLLKNLPQEEASIYRDKFKKSIIFWKKKGGSLTQEEITILQDLGIKIEVVGPSSRSKDKMIVKLNQKTPDDTDVRVLSKVPSWKRMCICILKGDTDCNYMGF